MGFSRENCEKGSRSTFPVPSHILKTIYINLIKITIKHVHSYLIISIIVSTASAVGEDIHPVNSITEQIKITVEIIPKKQ